MVRTEGVRLSRKEKQRMRMDAERPLRVIERLDFSRIYEDVPVEVIEGYTVTDSDTSECFAVFKIQNTGDKEISALEVRLLLYEGAANIPTRRLDFTYTASKNTWGRRSCSDDEKKQGFFQRLGLKDIVLPANIRHGESFGEGVLIQVPKSYCRKIEFEIRTVHFADGTSRVINIVSGKKYTFFKELDEDMRYAYRKMNVFARAEEAHPIKLIPQATDKVWLCCCGRKNLNSAAVCADCGREKDWQLKNITEASLERELDSIKASGDPEFIHRHKVQAGKQLSIESEEERKKKAADFEKTLEKLAEQERIKRHNQKMILPKIILWVVVIYGLIYLFQSFVDHQM